MLTLSTTAPADTYDIASALCRVLLKKHKTEDILTLDAILSTPLPLLKRRGFNVDRLLNQQHEERLRLRAEAQAQAQKDREAQVAAAASLAESERSKAKAIAATGQNNEPILAKDAASGSAPMPPQVPTVSLIDLAARTSARTLLRCRRDFCADATSVLTIRTPVVASAQTRD